jgi:hypothetical protein
MVRPLACNAPWSTGLTPDRLNRVGAIHRRARQHDRREARVIECLQFARVRVAIAIDVAPDAQIGECRVLRIDDAIAIGVECLLNGETVLRRRAENVGRAIDGPRFSQPSVQRVVVTVAKTAGRTSRRREWVRGRRFRTHSTS